MKDSGPFVCNMNALSQEQRLRHGELARFLRSALISVAELADGYDFKFSMNSETYDALSQITPLENACCPFLTIAIRLESDRRLFWQLTGSAGVKQFIRMEFGQWFQR